MPRRAFAVPAFVALLGLASCDAFDALLEAPAEMAAYLRITGPAAEVIAAQGQTASLSLSMIRLDGYKGRVSLLVEGLPAGVTATTALTSAGDVVTGTVNLAVSASVPTGSRLFKVRIRGERLKDSERHVTLRVLSPPNFALAVVPAEVRVIRGGVAPVLVTVARDNFTAPIATSVESADGITAAFDGAVSGDSAAGLLSVAGDAAPGTYMVTVNGSAEGFPARTATFTVVVLPDDIQVIADTTIATWQGRTVRDTFFVSARPGVGTPALSVDGLPAGVTAQFTSIGGSRAELQLDVSPLVNAGTYALTLRAGTAGASDATAPLRLTVNPSGVMLVAYPTAVSIFRGGTATVALTLQRTALDGAVAISAVNPPTGMTFSVAPQVVTANTATVTVSASGGAATGDFSVQLQALPSGWPAAAASTHVVRVSVRALPAGSGNVLLDWGECGVPTWVAVQDGLDGWVRLPVTQAAAYANITQSRGGIAYAYGDSLFTIRLLLQANMTAGPVALCDGRPTATMTGTGIHEGGGTTEQFRYGFGGASTTSGNLTPGFTLSGIAAGIHDLIAVRTIGNQAPRALIRRDIPVVDGGSLGTIDVNGSESFVAATASLSVTGAQTSESFGTALSYITSPSCIPSLYFTGGFTGSMFGIQQNRRRAGDLHMATVTGVQGVRERSATSVFREMITRSLPMPPTLSSAPTTQQLPAPYKRLQVSWAPLNAIYDNEVTFEYAAAGKRAVIRASRTYVNITGNVLAMPDLSTVDGWSNAFLPPEAQPTGWYVRFTGGPPPTNCGQQASQSLKYSGTG